MSPPSTRPTLPTEILQMVFDHLGHNDLRRLLKVNSYVKTVAQSFTYRHGAFTQFGLHFPDAPVPYPFFDNPDTAVVRLSDEERLRIARQVRRAVVDIHSSEECRCSNLLVKSKPKLDLQVLSVRVTHIGVRFEFCDLYVHSDSRAPCDDQGPEGEYPADYAKCFFLHSPYSNLTFDKLIIHGYPAMPTSFIPLPERKLDELVGVVGNCYDILPEGWYFCDRYPPGDPADGEGLLWRCAPSATSMTLIFWTRHPQEEWIPPCRHYHPPHAEGSPGVMSCRIAKLLWKDLAATLKQRAKDARKGKPYSRLHPKTESLRIVNAAAVIPPGYMREQHFTRLESGTASHDDAKTYFFKQDYWDWWDWSNRVDVKFETMQEWIKSGEWEDVFTEEEMRPWLKSMTQMG